MNTRFKLKLTSSPNLILSLPHWKLSVDNSLSSSFSKKISANIWKKVCTPLICSLNETHP